MQVAVIYDIDPRKVDSMKFAIESGNTSWAYEILTESWTKALSVHEVVE